VVGLWNEGNLLDRRNLGLLLLSRRNLLDRRNWEGCGVGLKHGRRAAIVALLGRIGNSILHLQLLILKNT
jgi:hypothetical protein